jgi:hypothetical protein
MSIKVRPTLDESPNHMCHASDRFVEMVLQGIRCEADPRTLALWAKVCGQSVGALRTHCYLAGVGPRRALDFTRLARATLLRMSSPGLNWADVLDVAEPRTISAMFDRAGSAPFAGQLSLVKFVEEQRLITNDTVRDRLYKQLAVTKVPRLAATASLSRNRPA